MVSRQALAATALFAAFVTQGAAIEPGLYELGDKGAIGKSFLARVSNVSLTSTSNDNSRCTFKFNYEGGYEGWLGVQTSSRLFQGHAQATADRSAEFSTVIYGEAAIKEIINRYNPAVVFRQHPGHRLMAEFSLKSSKWAPSEPLITTLHITNVGREEVTLSLDGQTVGQRDINFAFFATGGNSVLPDIGDPRRRLEPGGWVTLAPGSSHDIAVDLTQWFGLEIGKSYAVRGSYRVVIADKIQHTNLWDDFICAEFEVTTRK